MTSINDIVFARRAARKRHSEAHPRHPYNAELCEHYARIIIGRDATLAAELLEVRGAPAAVYALPVYWWAPSAINMGRKSRVAEVKRTHGYVVAGEGAWRVNPDAGTVTFTPEPGFTGAPSPATCGADDGGLIEVRVAYEVADGGAHDGHDDVTPATPGARVVTAQARPSSAVVVPLEQGPCPSLHLVQRPVHSFPVRISWDVPYVGTLAAGESLTAVGHVRGLGHDYAVSVRIDAEAASGGDLVSEIAATHGNIDSDECGRDARPHLVSVTGSGEARRILQSLANDGKLHYFQLLQAIESRAVMILPKIKASIALSITANEKHRQGRHIMDHEDDESVVREFVYGADGESAGDCFVGRAIERALQPAAFVRCDPQRRLHRELRRDLRESVERHIGDNRQGPKIRQIARELGEGATPKDVLAEFKRLTPGFSIGMDSIEKALDVGFAPIMVPVDPTREG